jgi:hypothetical protein
MVELGVTGERERSLLRAYCYDQLGQKESSASELEKPLELFLNDANIFLLMANVAASNAAGQSGSATWTDWVNRIYRLTHLPDLVVEAPSLQLAAVEQISACRAASIEDADVTVILTILKDHTTWEMALKSLAQQTHHSLQVMIVDRTNDASVKRSLQAWVEKDNRIAILDVDAGLPLQTVQNKALDLAQTRYVVFQQANECAHSVKIEKQLAALLPEDAKCAVSQRVRMSTDRRVFGEWAPDFRMFNDHAAGAMFETDAIKTLGGWDTVSGNPEAFLMWRLKKSFGHGAVQAALPHVPLSVVVEGESLGQPAHLEFPFGQLRNEFRALLRREKSAKQVIRRSDQDPEPRPVPPFRTLAADAGESFDLVFVGDFSGNAAAIEQLRSVLSSSIQNNAIVGLFHWPEYETTWSDDLDEVVADLIDSGVIQHISAYSTASAKRLILCNPFVVRQHIDGFPNFQAQQVDVLFGPEFHTVEFDDGLRGQLPSSKRLEEFCGMAFNWKTL